MNFPFIQSFFEGIINSLSDVTLIYCLLLRKERQDLCFCSSHGYCVWLNNVFVIKFTMFDNKKTKISQTLLLLICLQFLFF